VVAITKVVNAKMTKNVANAIHALVKNHANVPLKIVPNKYRRKDVVEAKVVAVEENVDEYIK